MDQIGNYLTRADEAFGDWMLGITTTEFHVLIDPSHPERRGYGPTEYRDWRIIKRHIALRGTFIDYGAGLGRVTILAARLPFDSVIGVEFDPILAARCQENIRRAESRATIDCTDARDFDIPADAGVLFFCNPFSGSLLADVLDKARMRHAMIVCNLPPESVFEKEIRHAPGLRLTKTVALHHGRKCLIFSTGADAAHRDA